MHTDMLMILEAARSPGIKTKSGLARSHADHLAAAASRGFISTQTAYDVFGRTWLLTSAGLGFLQFHKGLPQ